jgi:hypothetical protein
MPSEQRELGTGGRFLATVALVMAVILQLFLIHMVIRLRLDVAAQRQELAAKADLINLAVNLTPGDPAMRVLESKCTGCHGSAQFAPAQKIDGRLLAVVEQMSGRAGAGIPTEDIPGLCAALSFTKCAHCHSGERVKEMAILNPRERWELIMRMTKLPGAAISEAEARTIRDFYQDFWAWQKR